MQSYSAYINNGLLLPLMTKLENEYFSKLLKLLRSETCFAVNHISVEYAFAKSMKYHFIILDKWQLIETDGPVDLRNNFSYAFSETAFSIAVKGTFLYNCSLIKCFFICSLRNILLFLLQSKEHYFFYSTVS